MSTLKANVDGVSHDSGRLASGGRRIGHERHAVTAVAALIWVCGAAAATHISPALCATHPQTLTIEDPRPIAKALELLQSKYGYVVTYEDPRYTYEGDLKDVSQQMTGSVDPRHRIRTLVPVGGAVNISVPTTAIDSRTLTPVLSQLLQSHAALQKGGHFRLLEEGGVFHVIPTEVQDRSGNWQPQSSLLDSTITVPKLTNADGMTMLDAICESLTRGSGARVLVGTVPVNMLMQHRGDLEANSEVARAVLLRALAFSSPQLSWSLLYDAGLQIFVLNVSLIEKPRPTSMAVQQR
jgi:hypothetical protein